MWHGPSNVLHLFVLEDAVNKTSVEVVAYDPRWLVIYQLERGKILKAVSAFLELEHVCSTAIPNQRAKPIIDIDGGGGRVR